MTNRKRRKYRKGIKLSENTYNVCDVNKVNEKRYDSKLTERNWDVAVNTIERNESEINDETYKWSITKNIMQRNLTEYELR